MEKDVATVQGHNYTMDDFCYKPITGEGCLEESPMGYFQMSLETLMDPATNVKETAQCIPPPNATTRICFDQIGTPVLTYAVFGGITCEEGTSGECQACLIDAPAMQFTFLLNKNDYSLVTAEEWERQVFIRNVKSFNYALNNSYHIDMTGPMEGIDYNYELVDQIRMVYDTNPGMILVKADYLAERSIEDNIVLESKQNGFIVFFSYTLMFIYVSVAIGFFPSTIYSKFALGAVGICVVIGALLMSMGLTFYFNAKLTMISAEVVPFLILAIGVDNMFLIARAERDIPAIVTNIDDRISYAMKEIGPSIFTAAFCETCAFIIGMLTDVPALKNFCLIAALGVACDFLL
jgi:Niemann-Pick C1 protein